MIRPMLGVQDIFLGMLSAIFMKIIAALRFLGRFLVVFLIAILVQRLEMFLLLFPNRFTEMYSRSNHIATVRKKVFLPDEQTKWIQTFRQ
jgi:hypothetical protein